MVVEKLMATNSLFGYGFLLHALEETLQQLPIGFLNSGTISLFIFYLILILYLSSGFDAIMSGLKTSSQHYVDLSMVRRIFPLFFIH